jgi:hypothetical protein
MLVVLRGDLAFFVLIDCTAYLCDQADTKHLYM